MTDRAPPYCTSLHEEEKDRKTTERQRSTIKHKYFMTENLSEILYIQCVYVSRPATVQE